MNWTYNFQTAGSAPGLKTTGLKEVADPTPSSNCCRRVGFGSDYKNDLRWRHGAGMSR
jgi:hypothetical protein